MPELPRPNSDALLKTIQKKESSPRGRLKIFFGYAAGVGKTYAMLEAAHRAKEAGLDVVAGYIEPHTPPRNHGFAGWAGAAPHERRSIQRH